MQKIELLRVTRQCEDNGLIGEDQGLSHIDGITPHTESIDVTIPMALACSTDAPNINCLTTECFMASDTMANALLEAKKKT